MELEFYKCHSMGTDYIIIDNRSGKYDVPLRDKNFCKTLLNYHYGVGGLYLCEIHHDNDGGFEVRFVNQDGGTGYYGGSNTTCTSLVAKMLGLFRENHFTFVCNGQKYVITYDEERKKFWIPFNGICSKSIRAAGTGYLVDTPYQQFVQVTDDLDSLDVNTRARNLLETEVLKRQGRGISVTFFERTNFDHVYKARTYSGAKKGEIPNCGSGGVAVAATEEFIKMNSVTQRIPRKDPAKNIMQVQYRGGTVFVAAALTNDSKTSQIQVGLQATFVFKANIAYDPHKQNEL